MLNALLLVVIILTIYISTLLDININNFSDLITIKHPLIYIWSIICSSYTTISLSIIKKYSKYKLMLLFIYLNLIIFIPYNPTNNMMFSQIHIIIAFFGFIYLLNNLLYEVYYLYLYKGTHHKTTVLLFLIMCFLLYYLYFDANMVNIKFQLVFILLYTIILRLIVSSKSSS